MGGGNPFFAALILAVILLVGWGLYNKAHSETASWYGAAHAGRLTASGERFDPDAMTCAHRTLPFHTVLRLRWRGKTALCRVNDRGPFVAGRQLDVSRAVAARLGMIGKGVARVTIELERLPT